jgi:hypothetical protein
MQYMARADRFCGVWSIFPSLPAAPQVAKQSGEIDFSSRNAPDALGQLGHKIRFVDVAEIVRNRGNHAGVQQGDKNKRDFNSPGENLRPGRKAILDRHENVADNHIGLKENRGLNQLLTITDGANDFKVCAKQFHEDSAHGFMVLANKHT